MYLVEGGMSFDTRNAVASARAFQKELVNTGRVAQGVSRSGQDLEENFSSLGSAKTRAAIRGLQASLMGAKDGTDAAIAGAKALQVALVKSLVGTAIISGAGVLSDSVRDVGAKIGAAADESMKAMRGFDGFAQSLEEGAKRSDILAASADNTLKALEGLKNAGIFQAYVFKLFRGEQVLKDLEETTRGAARAEFGAGAQAGRITAERRAGMTPEQIEQDKRRQEEEARIREARLRGGAGAESDVRKTIEAENLLKTRQKGAESQKKFEKDLSDFQIKTDQIQQDYQKEIERARLDALVPATRILELDKESARISEQIASIKKDGIYGTEQARQKQLQSLEELEKRSLEISRKKLEAIKEQKAEQAEINKKIKEEADKKTSAELDEIKRQRELQRTRREAADEVRRLEQQQKQEKAAAFLQSFQGQRNFGQYGFQPSGRYGRAASGFGMERPEGYIPSPAGVNVLFGQSARRGKPSMISPDNPYKRTRIRGEEGQSFGPDGDLAKAIRELAKKIPSAVPV